MKAALYIIVDVSGSMNEMGKVFLLRNLCRYVAQLQLIDQEKYTNLDIHFYRWAQNISEIAVQSDGDVPALYTESSSCLDALSNFLSDNLNKTERAKVLILTDGNFSTSDILSFKRQLSSFPDLIIRTVAVGADADLGKLKKISTNDSFHLSENIASAIDAIFFGDKKDVTALKCTARILQHEPVQPAEDWDA